MEKNTEIYEQNMKVLQKKREELYDRVENYDTEAEEKGGWYAKLCVGTALDGDKFLAVLDSDNIIPLASTYSPRHQAERYILQYQESWDRNTALLFGLANVEVIRKILSKDCKVDICVVYEPSIGILKKVLEEYDIRDLLEDPCMILLVGEEDKLELPDVLRELLDYKAWKSFTYTSFACYEKLFAAEEQEVKELAEKIVESAKVNLRTLTYFSQAGMKNEIYALYWMIDGKLLDDYVGQFPEDMPCVVVAAGPSLERNVEVLHQIKGKALIICVDSALAFLLERGITPDLAVTIDPQKGASYFCSPELSQIPFVVTPSSDYRALETVRDIQTIYFDAANEYYQKLYYSRGAKLPYFNCGGSVGTASFQIGVQLGFKTIILIGQDLAFTDHKAHAGKGKAQEEDMLYNFMMVDAYDGGKIMTRADFNQYINWYNTEIPKHKEILVINATEGGAKLSGAIQMPLSEVAKKYCQKEYDIKQILDSVQPVWETKDDKAELYNELKKKHESLKTLKKKILTVLDDIGSAISFLRNKSSNMREFDQVKKRIDGVVQEVLDLDGIDMLVKRMIDVDASLNDDLLEGLEDANEESVRLYQKMKIYLEYLKKSLEEMLPTWNETLIRINDKYHFE